MTFIKLSKIVVGIGVILALAIPPAWSLDSDLSSLVPFASWITTVPGHLPSAPTFLLVSFALLPFVFWLTHRCPDVYISRPTHSFPKLFGGTVLLALVWVVLLWAAYDIPSIPTKPFSRSDAVRIIVASTRLGLGILWSLFILFLALFSHMSFIRLPLMWRDRARGVA